MHCIRVVSRGTTYLCGTSLNRPHPKWGDYEMWTEPAESDEEGLRKKLRRLVRQYDADRIGAADVVAGIKQAMEEAK